MERRPNVLQQALAQLRVKITFPYALLAILVAAVAAYLVTRLLVGLLENRFETALLDAGHKATDTVVRVEQEQLAVWRTIAYVEGFAEAVAAGDGDEVGLLASPYLLNAHLDCMEVLDRDGNPLLAMHHWPGGAVTEYSFDAGDDYANWPVVQQVLAGQVDAIGDKYAALVETDWGWIFYTAGPIKVEGQVVGVLLVGTYLDDLVERLDRSALARVSIYVGDGPPLATTLAAEEPATLAVDGETYRSALAQQADMVARRDVEVAGRRYAQVFGAFEARHGHDLGVLSVALPLSFVTDASSPTRAYLLWLFGAATALVILTGTLVASAVVRRIRRLAAATRQVARGDLSTQVEMRGVDEVAALARDFNAMVAQLREGRLYRDLLGMTTSPEVAERLRESVQMGRLQLEAQSVVATVLFIDIRGFTRMSESRDPAYVLQFLNEYLQGLVAIIRRHDGVVNKFIGDAALAFFGVLPEARPPEESARDAIAAALEIEDYLREFNRQRQERGEEAMRVGIGINTGPVVAGTLGSEDRLEYTVLGDTVNISQRLSDLSREYTRYEVFVNVRTYELLGEDLRARAIHLGHIQVKGRAEPVDVYVMTGE